MTVTQRDCRSQDGLKLAYQDYWPAAVCGPAIICLHGLTRTGRDFEVVAPWLAQRCRVLVPDVRGRGLSDRDPDFSNYHPLRYVEDTLAIMRDAAIERAVFVGTSLGGLISMGMALAHPDRVLGVVLNDVGPRLSPEGIERIAAYVGKLKPVSSWNEAAAQQKLLYGQALPDYTDDDWIRHARRAFAEDDNGIPVADSDPNIARAIEVGSTQELDPWQAFEALKAIPALLLRGALSDILSLETVADMQAIKADLKYVEVPNRGHAPTLEEADSQSAIAHFLNQFESSETRR